MMLHLSWGCGSSHSHLWEKRNGDASSDRLGHQEQIVEHHLHKLPILQKKHFFYFLGTSKIKPDCIFFLEKQMTPTVCAAALTEHGKGQGKIARLC